MAESREKITNIGDDAEMMSDGTLKRLMDWNFKEFQKFFTQRKIRVMRLALEYSFFVEKNGKNPDNDFCEDRFNEFIGKLNELYREKGDYLLLLAYDTHITKSSGKVFHQMIMTYPMEVITSEEWSELWEWGYISYNVISYERPCLKLERLRRRVSLPK